jgi:AmmeMemoRadiSam system protein A
MLSDDQKAVLLQVARESMTAHVLGRSAAPADAPVALPDASGVFVTIKRRGELRGCLGTLQCRAGLAQEVSRCARDSASEDPRFPRVTRAELPDLTLEVSILGPLEQIDPREPDAVVVGRHGLVVEDGRRRGLLLPQVPVEWGWTREQFLKQTCTKAGLAEDCWSSGAARVYRFEAEVFGE